MGEEAPLVQEKPLTEAEMLAEVKSCTRGLTGGKSIASDEYVAMMILLAVPVIGVEADDMSRFIGFKGKRDKQVRRLLQRAFDIGILCRNDDGSFSIDADWPNPELEEDKQSISFTLDAMCVAGSLMRTKDGLDPNDKFKYESTRERESK